MIINKDNYKEVLKGKTILEVSGEGCANCITMMPILHKLVQKYKNIKLNHLEVSEENRFLITKYEINRIPAVLIMEDETVVASCYGFQPEEILELWLDAKINID